MIYLYIYGLRYRFGYYCGQVSTSLWFIYAIIMFGTYVQYVTIMKKMNRSGAYFSVWLSGED